MQKSRILLTPSFSTVFDSRFNCDLIEWDNVEDTLFDAEVVVRDLMRRGMAADDIIRLLDKVLAQWGPEVIEEFTGACNVDWSFDLASEEMLKAIITRMLETARFGKNGSSVGFEIVLANRRPEDLAGGVPDHPDLTGKVSVRRYDLHGTAVGDIGTFSMDAEGNFRDQDGTVLGRVGSGALDLTAEGKAKLAPYHARPTPPPAEEPAAPQPGSGIEPP